MSMCGTLLNYSLLFGSILMIGALSGFLSEKAGIVNIGIDGMMCFGAVFYSIFSSPVLGFGTDGPMGNFGMIFSLLLTMVATSLIGVLHAYATINLKSNHVISGTAINLIGIAFATFVNPTLASSLYNGVSRLESGYHDFLYIGGSIYGSSIMIFTITIMIMLGVFFFTKYTKTGLRYRAVGENPFAVAAQGISVFKYQWIAVILSAAFAGLAGGLFLFNVNNFPGNTQGIGYLALAIMIVGAWRIDWIIIASIVFAMFTALSLTNILTNVGIARELALAIPYIINLFVLLFFSKWVRAPEHDGIPFEYSKR